MDSGKDTPTAHGCVRNARVLRQMKPEWGAGASFFASFFEGKCPKNWSDSVIWKVRTDFVEELGRCIQAVRFSVFGIRSGASTLLGVRILCFGVHVCFGQVAENFTTPCVLNVFGENW